MVKGRLQYTQCCDAGIKRTSYVHRGMWFCEPLLWTSWAYQGDMRTQTECSFLNIDQTSFTEIMFKSHLNTIEPSPLLCYGRSYVCALNQAREELTDLDF